jgi:hypothetical protein
MYSKFTRNSFFRKYEAERKSRNKIPKEEMKLFKQYKEEHHPFDPKSLKYNKYPDEPLSEFDNYDKKEMQSPAFVKVKYNPLQNNLIGEIYYYIAVDLKGPFNIKGFKGESYFMCFIDAKASMQSELYMIPNKRADTTSKQLSHYLETVIIPNRKNLDITYQFSIFHSDNGSEFMSHYKQTCKNYNLRQTFSVVDTPEQNSVVERYWRTLMGPLLAFMFSAKLDKRLWPFCASFVNDLLNKIRIITYKGQVTTTYQVITKSKANLSNLRTWGCECFALDTRKYDPRHFTEKAFKGYLMGYVRTSDSCLIFEPLNEEVILTNHIKFNEIVHGIRDVNNISIVNLNFQSVKPNDPSDKFYSEPFSYWNSDDDEDLDDDKLSELSIFKPENGTNIGNNNANHGRSKASKRTRDIMELQQVNLNDFIPAFQANLIEDVIMEPGLTNGPTITLGSLNYEKDYKDPNQDQYQNEIPQKPLTKKELIIFIIILIT